MTGQGEAAVQVVVVHQKVDDAVRVRVDDCIQRDWLVPKEFAWKASGVGVPAEATDPTMMIVVTPIASISRVIRRLIIDINSSQGRSSPTSITLSALVSLPKVEPFAFLKAGRVPGSGSRRPESNRDWCDQGSRNQLFQLASCPRA